jgi:cytochrome oxidase Cu insertion factor (SCO1/SenC/PrrC family)
MTELENIPKRKTYTPWLLMLVFVLPVLASYTYFFYGDHNNSSTSNNGELITPVIAIESLALTDGSNKLLSRKDLTYKWSMLYIVGKNCDEACNQGLYHMRQINIALGKNADRFQHWAIHLDATNPEFTQLIELEYPNTLHAYTSRKILSNVFSTPEDNLLSNNIYIMDPIGNIMMRYTPEISPKLILKDLNKLLKVSQIG